MPEFGIRSDSVNVEQVMEQIRARIREKRGIDYTEQEIRDLASVKLEKMLDARGIRTDLLDQFQKTQDRLSSGDVVATSKLFESHRGPVRLARRLLLPVLKLFINPTVLAQAVQRSDAYPQFFELLHNLVLEITRLGIEAKNLKMRVESLSARLEFSERRVRALEGVVVYKSDEPLTPAAPTSVASATRTDSTFPSFIATPPHASSDAGAAPGQAPAGEGPGQRNRRRRRRRGRRGGRPPAAVVMGGQSTGAPDATPPSNGGGSATPPSEPAAPAPPSGSGDPDTHQ
jgi:hypothetical protein